LCRSGKEAQFLAGGELPIKITAHKRQDVVWKKYGVLLKIKPVADFSGRMSIALETEVSTIDTSNTVDGLPGLLTNRIESHFDLKESRTIALSGLIKHQSGQSSQGLPGLSSVPILGSLFASREFRDDKTELVVFVTPEVVDSSQSEEP
jgi:pilus assembly protein CpaC